MASKKILLIKDWYGTKKGDLKIEVVDYRIERFSYGTQTFDRLTIRRKPDQFSSRIGMMAQLNKSRGKLSWGFSGMTLKDDELSQNGRVSTHKEFNFQGAAVEKLSMEGALEVITLISFESGYLCIGKC